MAESVPLPAGSLWVSQPASGADRSYLAFVDGLRAISILAVVGCHIGVPGFAGGYIGVDIFFVISGFLIINQIKDGLDAGKFSIVSFYARRVLRILPAFMIMMLAVVLIAPFTMSTPDLAFEFLKQAAMAPLMVNNIHFYLSQGYFDLSAYQKPLLHTWTLSVEEQFYVVAPILLVLLFHWRKRRFDRIAVAIGLCLAVLSLAGAIVNTSADDRNAAFYLMQWRMWEFIAGGFIGAQLVAAARHLPAAVVELMGLGGLACIVASVQWFDGKTLYPSWHALLPVAGAVSIIVAELTRPRTIVGRLLATRAMVGIGLVSYAWYLWHWPILSFMRMFRLGETWIAGDFLGGGVLGFVLASGSYFAVERPIRLWKKSGGVHHPRRIFAGGIAACWMAATLGGLAGFGGYVWTKRSIASLYRLDGRGALDNGCRIWRLSDIPSHCMSDKLAVLMGDSRAESIFDGMARNFGELDRKLILVGWGGCSPLLFAPSQRAAQRQNPRCGKLIAPFERLLTPPSPVVSVVITPSLFMPNSPELWSELISQFDPSRTRFLLLSYPAFKEPSLDCVVLSDRYGISRDRCNQPRSRNVGANSLFKILAEKNANIRYVDASDAFCDDRTCRPYEGNQLFYRDAGHLSTSGADRVFDRFESDFRWVTWKN